MHFKIWLFPLHYKKCIKRQMANILRRDLYKHDKHIKYLASASWVDLNGGLENQGCHWDKGNI